MDAAIGEQASLGAWYRLDNVAKIYPAILGEQDRCAPRDPSSS